MRRYAHWIMLLIMIFGFIPGALAQEATPAPPPVISTVNGQEIATVDFQNQVIFQRFWYAYLMRETINELAQQGADANTAFSTVQQIYEDEFTMLSLGDAMGANVLARLEENAVLEQLLAEEGSLIDDTAVDAIIVEQVGQATQLLRSPSAEATAEPALQTAVSALITETERRLGLDESVVRAYFRGEALRQHFTEAVAGEFPTELPHVTVRHILVDTEAEANAVLERLAAGEAFADLAQELSLDTGSGARGGDLGTLIPDVFIEPFAAAVRETPLNEVIGPVQTEFGYHIIEVTARETQPLTDSEARVMRGVRRGQFEAWMAEQMAVATVERSDSWPDAIPVEPNGIELLRQMLTEPVE